MARIDVALPGAERQPLKILRWFARPNQAGTLAGFFDCELASGLRIFGVKLMRGPAGKPWVAMPAQKAVAADGQPKLDARGKVVWSNTIDFRDAATRDRFQQAVLAALREQFPDAFAAAPPPPLPQRRRPGLYQKPSQSRSSPAPELPNDGVADLWRGEPWRARLTGARP